MLVKSSHMKQQCENNLDHDVHFGPREEHVPVSVSAPADRFHIRPFRRIRRLSAKNTFPIKDRRCYLFSYNPCLITTTTA